MLKHEMRLVEMDLVDSGWVGRGKRCPVSIRREGSTWYLTGSASIDALRHAGTVVRVRTRSSTRPWSVVSVAVVETYGGPVTLAEVVPGERIMSAADRRRIAERAGRAEIWDEDRPSYIDAP